MVRDPGQPRTGRGQVDVQRRLSCGSQGVIPELREVWRRLGLRHVEVKLVERNINARHVRILPLRPPTPRVLPPDPPGSGSPCGSQPQIACPVSESKKWSASVSTASVACEPALRVEWGDTRATPSALDVPALIDGPADNSVASMAASGS